MPEGSRSPRTSVGGRTSARKTCVPVGSVPRVRTIQADALENSNFIESARAVQSIKLFNRQADREGQWLNRHADAVNADIRLGRAQVRFKMT